MRKSWSPKIRGKREGLPPKIGGKGEGLPPKSKVRVKPYPQNRK
jgi:hypothetical protein